MEAIEIVLEEQLSETRGSTRYERSESQRGYRNGSEKRTVTTSLGSAASDLPRGRVFQPDGEAAEFQSEQLPRPGCFRTDSDAGIDGHRTLADLIKNQTDQTA